jgi:hypothetical protein
MVPDLDWDVLDVLVGYVVLGAVCALIFFVAICRPGAARRS